MTESDRWKGEILNKSGRVPGAVGNNEVTHICTMKFTRRRDREGLREYLINNGQNGPKQSEK
jgi:hypothetical protein